MQNVRLGFTPHSEKYPDCPADFPPTHDERENPENDYEPPFETSSEPPEEEEEDDDKVNDSEVYINPFFI